MVKTFRINGKPALWLVAVVMLLGGCATKVEVKGDFPKPILTQRALTVGVYYPPEFLAYSYQEKSETRSERTIGIGKAQVSLFSTVLPSMFEKVVQVGKPGEDKLQQELDLVLTVNVDEFQYTVPKDTKVNMYEVWIKYNLQLFDSQGQLIADWILTAYGKTPSEMLKGEGDALNDAMIVALRDAGASFSLGFDKVPEIKQWLAHRKRSSI